MTKEQADKIISLLKEQNKRLGALQRIESDTSSLDEWGHDDNIRFSNY